MKSGVVCQVPLLCGVTIHAPYLSVKRYACLSYEQVWKLKAVILRIWITSARIQRHNGASTTFTSIKDGA